MVPVDDLQVYALEQVAAAPFAVSVYFFMRRTHLVLDL